MSTAENIENRTETGQQKTTNRLPKTHQDYWKTKLKRRSYRDPSGQRIEIPEWQVRMFHRGREGWFNLGTPNQAAAAVKARNVYLSLVSSGWDATIATYKPGPEVKPDTCCTVGEFFADVTKRSHLRGRTLRGYISSVRTIVAQIIDVEAGLRGKAKRKKWDYANGGHAAWREKIEAQKLSILTPDTIALWRNRYVSRAGADPLRRKSAERSAGTYLRCGRALFSPDVTSVLQVKIPPNPFTGVKIDAPRAPRYRSEVNPEWLVACAVRELKKSQHQVFLAFTLALWAGLRRKEADLLMWEQIDFEARQIHIRRTRHFEPKTEDSERDVDLPTQAMELIRAMKRSATSEFVLEGGDPNPDATYNYYRCDPTWGQLITWLRDKGITRRGAVHVLRKESGSWVASAHGIEAARQHLGHSDIRTTSDAYIEKKKRIEVQIPVAIDLKVAS